MYLIRGKKIWETSFGNLMKTLVLFLAAIFNLGLSFLKKHVVSFGHIFGLSFSLDLVDDKTV